MRPTSRSKHRAKVYAFLFLAVVLQISLWTYARGFQARWANVPPVPSYAGALSFGLGDAQFAYRALGVMLQNLGNTGGLTINIEEYDYDALKGWFLLTDRLDPASNFMPFLAGYYFGAVQDPVKAGRIVDYLAVQGARPEKDKWRWLARAAYLARYSEKDTAKALKLSQQLAALYPRVNLPFWARQMPVFILQDRGEKEAALAMVLETLKSEAKTMPREETYALLDFMCHRLLTKAEASKYQVCVEFKG